MHRSVGGHRACVTSSGILGRMSGGYAGAERMASPKSQKPKGQPNSVKAAGARKLFSSALRSADVSFDAAALFLLIASFGNSDGSRCFPSLELLATKSGHNRKWVVRHLGELRKAGWLITTKRGKGNLFHLFWGEIGPEREAEKKAERGPKKGPCTRPQNGVRTLIQLTCESPSRQSEPIGHDEQSPFHGDAA